MNQKCPYCHTYSESSKFRSTNSKIVRYGSFRRRSDSKVVKRFKCLACQKHFSRATFHPCYRQRKRQINTPLFRKLCSGVSLRRSAILLYVNRKTVARKLQFLGLQARKEFQKNFESSKPFSEIQFDDLETSEHTKCKPISITLVVESNTRRILGFSVARMPAKGLLAEVSRKKYGLRIDERSMKRAELFENLKSRVHFQAVIKSDKDTNYGALVSKYFSQAKHVTYKGRKGCVTGQGELKKGGFDPLFSLNHTCAMLRANINRLFRRTWCTTKKIERLIDHLSIYANYHNDILIKL